MREILQERGVNCPLSQNKFELVLFCELSVELNLEIIARYDVNDYKVMDLKRRTVEVNGVNVVIPSPTEMKTWQSHLDYLPDTHTYDILIFLVIYCMWDN